MARKIIKRAYDDPHNSIDLFDADRLNEFGEMYCVAPAILISQVKSKKLGYYNGRYQKKIR